LNNNLEEAWTQQITSFSVYCITKVIDNARIDIQVYLFFNVKILVSLAVKTIPLN